MRMRVHTYSDATALALGLEELATEGLTPRGLLFLALDSTGMAHLAVPERFEEVTKLRVGEKLGLGWSVPGRFYHYDSVHRLGRGVFLWNGDRRLPHPGDADDVAGAITVLLKIAGSRSVFFGCTPHQPGSWITRREGTVALHDEGFVGTVPVDEQRLLARRILDHRLWLLSVAAGEVVDRSPVFESDLGNVLMLERRLSAHRLVLTCEHGLIEIDVEELPRVRECDRVETDGSLAVVGRLAGRAFAVTYGTKQPWGLDDMAPAVLIGAEDGSLPALGRELARMAADARR